MKCQWTRGSIIKWIFIGFLFAFFFVPTTFKLFRDKWVISRAIAHAKSVRLEHYRSSLDNFGTEQIIASKDLAPQDFHRVNDAFPYFLDIGFPLLTTACIFNPHHRVVITDPAGNITTIKVCFECDHMDIEQGDKTYGDEKLTPFIWMHTLRDFFAEEGMPNSPELYRRSYSETPPTNQAPAANK